LLGSLSALGAVRTSQDIDPEHIDPELATCEPYVMGSHAACSGVWASGQRLESP
jgi:adenylylsulfate reductase subunit A